MSWVSAPRSNGAIGLLPCVRSTKNGEKRTRTVGHLAPRSFLKGGVQVGFRGVDGSDEISSWKSRWGSSWFVPPSLSPTGNLPQGTLEESHEET